MAQSVQNEDERSELLFRRRYPDGELYADLTGYYSRIYGRAALGAGDEPLPVRRRAGAGDLDVHRPDPGQAQEGRRGGHHDRREPPGGGRRRRSATSPARWWRWILGPATCWRCREPHLRPQHAVATGRTKSIVDAWNATQRRPGQAPGLAREGRAVPAGFHRQADHGVGGPGERLRPGVGMGQPAVPRPAAELEHARELRQLALQRRFGAGDDGRGLQGIVQRHVRRDRPEAGRQEHERPGAGLRVLPHRSAGADRLHRAHDPVRAARSRTGTSPSRPTSRTTSRCWRSARSVWTTCSRTRCTWP